MFEQALLADDAAAVEHNTNERLAAQAGEEEVAFELWEAVRIRAAIEGCAGGGDGGRVFEERGLKSGARLRVMNQGPAVIFAALDDVDFVATAGAVEARRAVLGLEHEI